MCDCWCNVVNELWTPLEISQRTYSWRRIRIQNLFVEALHSHTLTVTLKNSGLACYLSVHQTYQSLINSEWVNNSISCVRILLRKTKIITWMAFLLTSNVEFEVRRNMRCINIWPTCVFSLCLSFIPKHNRTVNLLSCWFLLSRSLLCYISCDSSDKAHT